MATTVLLSTELAAVIASYQRGHYTDVKFLRSKLCPIYKNFYEPSFIQTHMKFLQDFLQTWLNTYGVGRLPKLIAASRVFQLVLTQYAVYFGHLDLAAKLHEAVNLCSFHDPLVSLAALNGHLNVLEFLQRIQHPGQNDGSIVWAAAFGHLAFVQFLNEHNNFADSTRISAMKAAARNGHASIVQYMAPFQSSPQPRVLTLAPRKPSLQPEAKATAQKDHAVVIRAYVSPKQGHFV
ncbi:unnamed protein product [Aphanomyces euteiches]